MHFFDLLYLKTNRSDLLLHRFVYGLCNLTHFFCDLQRKILNDSIGRDSRGKVFCLPSRNKAILEVADEDRMGEELIDEVSIDNGR